MSDRLAVAVTELIEALRESVRAEAAAASRSPDRLYSIDEAASALGLGRSLLMVEIGAGRLRSMKVGRRRLVPAAAIAGYIAERIA